MTGRLLKKSIDIDARESYDGIITDFDTNHIKMYSSDQKNQDSSAMEFLTKNNDLTEDDLNEFISE